ncbi:MAG: ABC transporter ATP-binding protein [Chloroflexi bacterium]|nr:ABC transporter ATP-binding protein [Chloroflexota bacterium]
MSVSSEIAIHVENLSKEFKLYSRPLDMFIEMVRGKPRHRPFWALQNISFDVYRGQVVGILGRNGAGKSTLLKIITGTLDKSSGAVQTHGRISSILELGTGFSGEYTGRENIYLGGLMVGLSREEIQAKEDWIIEFSELRDFVDQPFKTYSTGMQARLTFATAVCIDPDILIVDEALSVGDARFARKSFSQMEKFRKEGRTILFVSHDTNQVVAFCDHAIILEHGRVYDQGAPSYIRGVYYDLLFGKGKNSVAGTGGEIKTEYSLDVSKVKNEIGFCWQIGLAEIPVLGDSSEYPESSFFVLCEDGRPLGTGHSLHDNIRNFGKGLFSHWGSLLLFSTSDNSDPRTNGRKYSMRQKDSIEDTASMEKQLEPQEEDRPDESPERRDIRHHALKKLGLTQPFVDSGNTHVARYGNGKAELLDFGILDEQGNKVRKLVSGSKYTLFSRAVVYEKTHALVTGFTINNIYGIELVGINSFLQEKVIYDVPQGSVVETKVPVTMWITNGTYFLSVAIGDPEADTSVQFDQRFDALQFEVDFTKGIHTTSMVNLNADYSVEVVFKESE